METSRNRAWIRRGLFIAVSLLATIAVFWAGALGGLLSQMSCEGGPYSGLHGAYCSEPASVGTGPWVTVFFLSPIAITIAAATVSWRRDNWVILAVVAVAMIAAGGLLPWLLWQ
jgi:hypothetical protein